MTGRARVFRGIGASPGVAIGRVFLLDRSRVKTPHYHIQPDQVDYEIERLRNAIGASVGQMETIRSRFVGDGKDHLSILEAHEMMLRDKDLLDETGQLIKKELLNAEWAVTRVVGRLRTIFARLSDPYFRERQTDVDYMGERILRNLMGKVADLTELSHLDDATVIVAHELSPVDTALLARHRVTAFVTEAGGKTSHTSIVARSMDVPAVVGVHGVIDAAGSGDLVVVDGSEGTVVLRPSHVQVERGHKRSEKFRLLNLELLEAKALPARTVDGRDVVVAGNIELPNEVNTVLSRGGEEIGLYRTEFMFLGRKDPPNEEDHYRTYCRIFDDVGGRRVTVRTLDLGGDKMFAGADGAVNEPNPALGLRAIRYCLEHRDIFEAQLAGLLRASTRGDLRIMLPMVSSIEELRRVKEIIATVQARLTSEAKEYRKDVPLGIMIEVPSAAITADQLAREADFFSIGTNDLLQYLLAVDRTNERVDYLYAPLHPAVLRTLNMIASAARTTHIPVSVCGELAGDLELTPILVGLGVQQLSMNAGSIPKVKRLVRELAYEECRALLEETLLCATHDEVADMVRRFMRAKVGSGSDVLDDGP